MRVRQSFHRLKRKLLRQPAPNLDEPKAQDKTGDGQTTSVTITAESSASGYGTQASITTLAVRSDSASNQQAQGLADPSPLALSSSPFSANADTSTHPSPNLAERLWDRAYDELKASDAALVQGYEKLLSRKLRGQALDSLESESEQNAIAQDDASARRDQMHELVRAGLEKTAPEVKAKKHIGEAMKLVLSMAEIVGSAVQTMPQPALAWTGLCLVLETFVENPTAEAEANRKGIEYVIKKMDWYCKLSSVVLKENAMYDSHLSGVRCELETPIVDLYKALLSYEMKSVCSYYRNRGLVWLRDIAKLDNWDGNMKAIQDAEGVFSTLSNTYTEQKISSGIEELVSQAKKQETAQMTEKDQQCLGDLRPTDPRFDKRRIEETKGGLLQESFRWILDNSEFRKWQNHEQSQLLWIKGDPGKGKTMLLCGIIDELEKQITQSSLVSFFFCQGTDSRINNAAAVLRGLIYMLVSQQPSLISHVRKEYDQAGNQLFQDANSWVALSEIFTNILLDPGLTAAYIIIDALDECVASLPQLLHLIVQNMSASPRVKWIVSSRNWPSIERQLAQPNGVNGMSLSLEVNADLVSRAVGFYIDYKVSKLVSIEGDKDLQDKVRNQMRQKANGTFLWVALVFKELQAIEDAEYEDHSDILNILEKMPSDLTDLYSRMLQQIHRLGGKDPERCLAILSTAILAYRPLHLLELPTLADFKGHLNERAILERLVNKCGSFLTVRDDTVYFVHQSAKDHLAMDENALSTIFPSGCEDAHHAIFSRSLQAIGNKLEKNIYEIPRQGLLIDQITTPDPGPLVAVRYSCVYWIYHLCEGSPNDSDLIDGGVIQRFFKKHFLHWLEALSLLHDVSIGVLSITKLVALFKGKNKGELSDLVEDARRFFLHNRWVIENSPLQIYSSALIFTPPRSLVREIFEHEVPSWITNRPVIDTHWSPCLQTLEGHTSRVESVAFSLDGHRLASGSEDKIVKVWNAATGECIQTLKGHSDWVRSITFSPDGYMLASGSDDKTVKVWNTATGECIQTIDVQTAIYVLSFDPMAQSRLYTNLGYLEFDLASKMNAQPNQVSSHHVSFYDYSIHSDGVWILKDGRPVLWLPPEYRPYSYRTSVVAGSKVVIGCQSGRVLILHFSETGPSS